MDTMDKTSTQDDAPITEMDDLQARLQRVEFLTLCNAPREPWPPGLNRHHIHHEAWPQNYVNRVFICNGCGRIRRGEDGPYPLWVDRRLCHQCLPVAQRETILAQERRIAELEFRVDQLLLYGRKKAKRMVEMVGDDE